MDEWNSPTAPFVSSYSKCPTLLPLNVCPCVPFGTVKEGSARADSSLDSSGGPVTIFTESWRVRENSMCECLCKRQGHTGKPGQTVQKDSSFTEWPLISVHCNILLLRIQSRRRFWTKPLYFTEFNKKELCSWGKHIHLSNLILSECTLSYSDHVTLIYNNNNNNNNRYFIHPLGEFQVSRNFKKGHTTIKIRERIKVKYITKR